MQTHDLVQTILDTHHTHLHEHLPRLSTALRKNRESNELIHAWNQLASLLHGHLQKEEQILFPAIINASRGLSSWDYSAPIHVMTLEHEQITGLEAQLRILLNHELPLHRECIVLLDDLSEHARREEQELFPQALALLDG